MAWPEPQYSRKQVAKAGKLLVDSPMPPVDFFSPESEKWFNAWDVLSNWRACHGYPINTFQATLRNRLKKIDNTALVAQRLKRTPSILNKLRRFQGMSLARMQDIGGLRAVVGSMSQLDELTGTYIESPVTHELVSQYNYVLAPKSSGYRSVHLVYRYKARTTSPYDGLLLELQLRTRLQHSWATAVETAGTFLEHSLKSSEGPEEWLSFFAQASSAFAYLEKSPRVPGFEGKPQRETFEATTADAKRLRVRDMLLGYSSAIQEIGPGAKPAAYYLVELNVGGEQKTVSISPFAKDQLQRANEAYAKAERESVATGTNQVVLVSAGSIESLRRAYPNYFLDTHEFLHNLSKVEARTPGARAKLRTFRPVQRAL